MNKKWFKVDLKTRKVHLVFQLIYLLALIGISIKVVLDGNSVVGAIIFYAILAGLTWFIFASLSNQYKVSVAEDGSGLKVGRKEISLAEVNKLAVAGTLNITGAAGQVDLLLGVKGFDKPQSIPLVLPYSKKLRSVEELQAIKKAAEGFSVPTELNEEDLKSVPHNFTQAIFIDKTQLFELIDSIIVSRDIN